MVSTEIVIVDTGVANIASVSNMLRKLGADPIRSYDPEVISAAQKLILPGVGSFDTAMQAIREKRLDAAIQQAVADGAYLLGICLGMQLLLDASEEGEESGLGLVPGRVVAFEKSLLSGNQRIPNMGWRTIESNDQNGLFEGGLRDSKFYFVHSYHVSNDNLYAIAHSVHGYRFPCAVHRDKIFGVQFHPEKSHKYGMKLLRNYLGMQVYET